MHRLHSNGDWTNSVAIVRDMIEIIVAVAFHLTPRVPESLRCAMKVISAIRASPRCFLHHHYTVYYNILNDKPGGEVILAALCQNILCSRLHGPSSFGIPCRVCNHMVVAQSYVFRVSAPRFLFCVCVWPQTKIV